MNAATGRFWTRDTYEGDQEDPLSLHKYLYSQDEPVDNRDPSGNAVYFVARPMTMDGLSALYEPGAIAYPVIGHGYLLFTCYSDPGTGNPFQSGQPVWDTFSFHPSPWLGALDLVEQLALNSGQKPGRVWEDHPDDTTPVSQNYYPVKVTTARSDQDKLAAYISNWIHSSPVGYDKGPPKDDPLDPGHNTIGRLGHANPPNHAIYYSFVDQNCVWWATIMLKQSGITVDPNVYNFIQTYELGAGAAPAVISGQRSANEENTVTQFPALETALPGYQPVDANFP
jgi:hypothetical protein